MLLERELEQHMVKDFAKIQAKRRKLAIKKSSSVLNDPGYSTCCWLIMKDYTYQSTNWSIKWGCILPLHCIFHKSKSLISRNCVQSLFWMQAYGLPTWLSIKEPQGYTKARKEFKTNANIVEIKIWHVITWYLHVSQVVGKSTGLENNNRARIVLFLTYTRITTLHGNIAFIKCLSAI